MASKTAQWVVRSYHRSLMILSSDPTWRWCAPPLYHTCIVIKSFVKAEFFYHFVEKPGDLASEKIVDTSANTHPIFPSQTLFPGPGTAACCPTTEEDHLTTQITVCFSDRALEPITVLIWISSHLKDWIGQRRKYRTRTGRGNVRHDNLLWPRPFLLQPTLKSYQTVYLHTTTAEASPMLLSGDWLSSGEGGI